MEAERPEGSPWPGPEPSPEPAVGALRAESVGLFGGSFDPVHRGHLTVAETVLERGGVEHLVLVPARISPHKLERPPLPGAIRTGLLRAALAALPEPLRERVSIWTVELERPGPSFTIDTVERLAAARARGATPPALVVGQDSLAGLPRWHRLDALLEAVRLLVVERGGSGPLEESLARAGAELAPEHRARFAAVRLTPERPSRASSTEVRRALLAGGVDLEQLPPEVERAIRASGLYRDVDGCGDALP